MFILNGRIWVIHIKVKSIVEIQVQWIVVKVTPNFLNTLVTLVFLIFDHCLLKVSLTESTKRLTVI